MDKIAIIGANEFQNPLILKAKEMGFETHVFAWKAGDIGERTADFFYPVSITEKDLILEKCRAIGVSAVASIGSDLAVHAVNHVARAMGFAANSPECEAACTDKYIMRRALQSAGAPSPRFALIRGDEIPAGVESFTFPIIVKPTDRSGSRGIFRLESPDGLSEAVAEARAQSFSKAAIAEEFIEGEEFSCESISFEGRHTPLAVTQKFTTGAPHYIETGHLEPAPLAQETYNKIYTEIPRALDALGIEYGASHAEFRISPSGEIRIIEIGARMGGDCIGSDLVRLSTGRDYLAMVIETALGRAPSMGGAPLNERAEVRFILTDSDYREYERALAGGRRIVRTSERIERPSAEVTDSSTRFGFYILA